jgi:ABC-type nitrate/sulfonate/bicarbonate transport system permease component
MSSEPIHAPVRSADKQPDGSAIVRRVRAARPLVMAIIAIASALVIWDLATRFVFNPILVPSPEATLQEAWSMIVSGELFVHVWVSLKRILVGFVLGATVGILVGLLIGRITVARELLDPLIELIRPISPVAMIPLSILWFGIGEASRYFIIFYATVIVVALNTAAGVAFQPVTRARAARCLGASEAKVFTHVVLPTAVPDILTGMRVAVGFSFMGVVAAEMIGASTGIGYLIMQSRLMVQPERMFVGLLSLSVVGLASDRLFRLAVAWSTKRFTQYQSRG